MINKKISTILLFGLILFLLISSVNAMDYNANNKSLENIGTSEMIVDDSSLEVSDGALFDDSSLEVSDGALINGSGSECFQDVLVDGSGSKDSNNLLVDGSGSKDSNNALLDESNKKTQLTNNNLQDEGEYLNVSDAYDLLNAFRTEENVWQWNEDDESKSYFNTNDTIWLKPLARDADLEETARIRAKELSERFSHVRPNGSLCFTIFPDGLIDYGENIGKYYLTYEEALEGWKEANETYSEQDHRRSMLRADFNCVGIAGYKLNGTTYWVQDFASKYNPEDLNPNKIFIFANNSISPNFKVSLPVYASGNFTVKVNGNVIATKSVSNGKAAIRVYGLSPGTYDVELSYSGDINYKAANKTKKISVAENTSPRNVSSFNYLNTLIQMAEGELKLEKDFTFNKSIDSSFKDGISISKSLTIDGQGHTINGNKLARIFNLRSGELILKNIIFTKGKADYGAAIFASGEITLINCSFANNSAAADGGAIYSSKSLHAINSTFKSNSAKGDGGAIYSSYYSVYADNSTFSSNSAIGDGGAICSSNSAFVENSTFSKNTARDLGGAIYANSRISASNSNFTKNINIQVFTEGLFFDTNNVFSKDKYFKLFNNASKDNGTVTLNNDLNATQTILIEGNNVVIDGNGYTIDAQGKSRIFYITGQNVTIRNIHIINGNSTKEGGAISSCSYNLFIINSTFENCLAQKGGAIYCAYGNLSIVNSSFLNNKAENLSNETKSFGGAIYTKSANIMVSNSFFINNTAFSGGGIFTDSGTVSINASCFKANDASMCGGAVSSFTKAVSISNSNFTDNDASNYGGAVYSLRDTISISNSHFRDNDAGLYGGAVFTSQDSIAYIRDSSFINNTSHYYGGAVSASKYLEISNSSFANNFASHDGGAVALWGELLLKNSSFINNSAVYGGALFDIARNASLSIISSSFINNTALQSCGALDIECNAFIANSSFINNTALNGTAGAIANYLNLSVANCSFINNIAIGKGGGASTGGAIRNFGKDVSVKNTVFINNSADEGGAINNPYYGNLDVANSTFVNNAANLGGAIINDNYWYWKEGYDNNNVSVADSTFINNTAEKGGAIYNRNSTFRIVNSTLSDNSGSVGDSIYDRGGSVYLINSTLKNSDPVDYALVGRVNHTGSKILESNIDVTGEYVNYTRVNNKTNGSGSNGTGPSSNGTGPSGSGNGTNPGSGNGTGPSGSGNGTGPSGSGNGTNPGSGNGTNPSSPSNGSSTNISSLKDSKISISVNNIIAGQNEIINFTLISKDNTPITGKIDVSINKNPYAVTINNGKGSLTVSKLSIGNYTVIANYNGDSKYGKSNASAKFTVRDRIATKIIYSNMKTGPVAKDEGRIGNYFCVRLVDEKNNALSGVPIKIGFNGKIYNRTTDSSGGAKLQINLAKDDIYTFAICFLGDDEYNASFEVAKIDVSKKYPKPNKANESTSAKPANRSQKNTRLQTNILYMDMVTESVLKIDGRVGKYFEIRLVDKNKKAMVGVPIKIGFNGKIYNRTTDSNGGAKLQINLLKPTTYTFAIAYLGDSKYQASFEVAKIKVNKQTPKLTASAKTFKVNVKTKTVSATLKSANGNAISGKKIKFTINGKTYSATTNAKGIASAKISLSKKGKYIATANFAGDTNIKATSVKFDLKIV